MDLFSHSWLPFMYQYGFGILIFGGGLFAVFKAYGGKEFWNQYKIWIQILIWGFIYVSSIHLLMTVSALNDYPQLYLVILSLYIFNVFLLHGVTGSGKTLVYMDIVKDLLKQNKQILLGVVGGLVLASFFGLKLEAYGMGGGGGGMAMAHIDKNNKP